MASTYSNLKIQLMATGENSGTWGNVTNVNLGTALEEAIAGSADVTFSSGNVTLTLTDTNASQTARNMRLNLTGTTGGARDLIVPAVEKMYLVNNGCADTVTIKVSGQTGIAVPAGKTMLVYNNGTDVVDAVTHLSSLTLGTDLAVAQGGTGASDAATARTNLGLAIGTDVLAPNGSGASLTSLNASNISSGTLVVARGGTGTTTHTSGSVLIGAGTGAITSVAYGTSGNVLTSNGSAWVSQAISAGGDYIMTVYNSPATWTKPASVKAIKVTVIGAGGNGGSSPPAPYGARASNAGGGGGAIKYLDAPAIPGPVAVTVGSPPSKTSSFGAFCSATGGTNGTNSTPSGGTPAVAQYPGGTGTGGDLNATGGTGMGSSRYNGSPDPQEILYMGASFSGDGAFGFGLAQPTWLPGTGQPGKAGLGYGAGGTGAVASGGTGGAGAPGVVIVEEFY